MSIIIDVLMKKEVEGLTDETVRRALALVLKEEGAELHLSVVLVDDAEIHRINRDFLQHDYPTDVISFDLRDDGPGADGEVLVSVDTARREASLRNVSLISEVLLYCVHGTLHLLGYDDHEPEERCRMHQRQTELLALIGHETAE